MNFRQDAQSRERDRESPLRLTPQFGEDKSQSAASGSVAHKKTPESFNVAKERGEKVR